MCHGSRYNYGMTGHCPMARGYVARMEIKALHPNECVGASGSRKGAGRGISFTAGYDARGSEIRIIVGILTRVYSTFQCWYNGLRWNMWDNENGVKKNVCASNGGGGFNLISFSYRTLEYSETPETIPRIV